MNKEELKIKLDEAGLARVSDQLFSLAKMSIRFTTTKSADEEIVIGASKVGGWPDLPPDYSFPKWKDVPLAFLAQINLADISSFSAASVLPSSGILSFFYSAAQETWGFNPKDKGSWQVFYFPNSEDFQRANFPADLPSAGCYSPCVLSYFEETTFPPYDSLPIRALEFSKDERKSYFDFLDETIVGKSDSISNRLFGYPDQIQGDMQLECQMVSNGIYYGDGKSHQHPRYNELKPDSINWNLLLQLDSEEENAKMIWGDVGRVYFWIHKAALSNREFEKSWFQFQCY